MLSNVIETRREYLCVAAAVVSERVFGISSSIVNAK